MIRWYNTPHRKDNGYASIFDYNNQQVPYNAYTSKYVLTLCDQSTLVELVYRATILEFCKNSFYSNKTILFQPYKPSSAFEYKKTFFSILPYIDFLFICDSDIHDYALFFYDSDTMSVTDIAHKFADYVKIDHKRPRIVIVLGRHINSSIIYTESGSKSIHTIDIPHVSTIDISIDIADDSNAANQNRVTDQHIKAFCDGFLIQLVRVERQIDLIHDTLKLCRGDPQIYLTSNMQESITSTDNIGHHSNTSNSSNGSKKVQNISCISSNSMSLSGNRRSMKQSSILTRNSSNRIVNQSNSKRNLAASTITMLTENASTFMSESSNQRSMLAYPYIKTDSLNNMITPAVSALKMYSARSNVMSRGNTFSRGNILTVEGRQNNANHDEFQNTLFFQDIRQHNSAMTMMPYSSSSLMMDNSLKTSSMFDIIHEPSIVSAEGGITDCILTGQKSMILC